MGKAISPIVLLIAWNCVAGCSPAPPPRADNADSPPTAHQPVKKSRSPEEWSQLIKSVPPAELGGDELVREMIAVIADPAAGWELRKQLALTLGRMGASAGSAVPTFRALLRNTEPDSVATRMWALKALGLMGQPAAEATDEVAAMALDEQQPFLIRATAMEALARVGAGREVTLRTLIRILQEDLDSMGNVDPASHELRMVAAESVSLLGPEGMGALPELLRALKSDWPLLRRSAATAIGRMGPPAGLAAQPLGDLVVFDEAGEVREAAADALGQMGPEGLSQLTSLIRTRDVPVRLLAVRGLRTAAGSGAEAALQAGLSDADDFVRASAAEACLSRDPRNAAAANALIGLLNSPDRSARKLAYETLRDGPVENLTPHRERLQQLRDAPHSLPQTVTAAQGLLNRLSESSQTL